MRGTFSLFTSVQRHVSLIQRAAAIKRASRGFVFPFVGAQNSGRKSYRMSCKTNQAGGASMSDFTDMGDHGISIVGVPLGSPALPPLLRACVEV